MCLDLGVILWALANSKAPELSSKALQYTFGVVMYTSICLAFISLRSSMRGITSLRAVDNAMYSASVVDRAIWVCNLEAQSFR
jgi:hypothetical protein